VKALKGGAVDFIQKPFDSGEGVAAVRRALERDAQDRDRRAKREQLAGRLAALTERERAVLQCIIDGKANKVIAAELDISVKTVEAHRAKVMEKMAADSVAELVQRTIGFSLMEGAGGGP
jgi:two-component system, LuxR family, response regulator FixJ